MAISDEYHFISHFHKVPWSSSGERKLSHYGMTQHDASAQKPVCLWRLQSRHTFVKSITEGLSYSIGEAYFYPDYIRCSLAL